MLEASVGSAASSIVRDAVAGGDNITIQGTGQVRFTGNVGGGGLHNVTVVGREIDDKLLGEGDLDWFWALGSDSTDRKKDEQLR